MNQTPEKPTKSFEEKKKSAQYVECDKIAKSSSIGGLLKGAGLKAKRSGLRNVSSVLREMQNSPERKATVFKNSAIAFKKRCMYFSYLFSEHTILDFYSYTVL